MTTYNETQLAKLIKMAAEAQLRPNGNPAPQLAPKAIAKKYGLTQREVTKQITRRRPRLKGSNTPES